MNIDKVYTYIAKTIANKAQTGNLTPSDFNSLMPRAFQQWVYKTYDDMTDGRGWQSNQSITDDLRFLLVRNKVMQVAKDGSLSVPNDYLHLSSINYNYTRAYKGKTITKLKPVDVVRDNERAAFTGSDIYAPLLESKKYVISAFFDTYLQFYPANVGRVEFTYLRKPIDPVWNFTVVNGRPVYDPITSVDLEAPDEAVDEIAMIALSLFGINIRDQELISFSEAQKAQNL
jgi:hypothetical protein